MALINDIRTSVTHSTPVLAVVGATDLAVERVRSAAATAAGTATTLQADVEKTVTAYQDRARKAVSAYQAALEPAAVQARVQKVADRVPDAKALSATVQQVPALAVARALEVAGQVETSYTGLAERGKGLVSRIGSQQATQDLIAQGRTTVGRTRAAVTTARKAVDETAGAALQTVAVGRRDAKATAEAVEQQLEQSVAATEKVVAQRTSGTRAAAKRTATTAKRSAAGTRSAAKGASTSARKAARQAEKAAEAGAQKVGD